MAGEREKRLSRNPKKRQIRQPEPLSLSLSLFLSISLPLSLSLSLSKTPAPRDEWPERQDGVFKSSPLYSLFL